MSTEPTQAIVEADFRTILRFASQFGLPFKGVDDLGRVNRKRLDQRLPQFRLASTRMSELGQKVEDNSAAVPPVQIAVSPPMPTPEPIELHVKADEVEYLMPSSGTFVDTAPEVVRPTSKPKIERNLRGLTEYLFEELDALREGRGSVERVRAVCDAAGRISTIIHAQIKVHQYIGKSTEKDEREALKSLAG